MPPVARSKPSTNGNGDAPSAPRGRIAAQALAAKRLPENPRVDELAEKMDEDYQVSLVRRAIEAGLQAIPVTFSVEGDTQDDRADALAKQLADLWEQTLGECSEGLSRGRVAFEKVFDYVEDDNLHVVRKFDRLPFKMTRMTLNEAGQFAGIEIQAKSKWELIPADKSWWLAINPTPLQPHGTGLYTGAPHKTWRTRQEAIRLRDVHIRRFVLEWLLIRCRPTNENEEGQLVDNFTRMLDAVDAMRSGGAMAVSNERNPETNEPLETVEAIGAERKDANHLDDTIDGMDAEQVRAFGFPESVITDGSIVGSYAKLKQQSGLFFAICLSVLRQVATSFQRYVVDKVLPLNFGPDVTIRVVYPKMTEQQEDWVIEVAKGLLVQPALSPLILSGAVDVRQMLEGIGVPLSADAEERLERFLAEQRAAAAAAGGGQPTQLAGDPLDGPTGEYSAISRLQWKRNRAGIEEVLSDLATGAITETRARVYLRGFGVPDSQIEDLIADAADGTVDSHALARRLAHPRVPKNVVTKQSILHEALAELARLKDELRAVVVAGAKGGKLAESRVAKILAEIRRVNIAATFAARLVGMCSPWKPSLTPRPAGAPKPDRLPAAVEGNALARRLAIAGVSNNAGDFWRFPWIEDAAAFLRGKNVATPDELRAMAADVQRQVLSAPGVTNLDVLGRIKDALAESISTGETRQQFAARIDRAVALTDAQMETLFRTNTHQAYIEGQERTLSDPAIDEEFPYVMLNATRDTRTREEHEAVDGFVVRRGTPEYEIIRRLLDDWGCRCGLTVLNEDDARGYGVKTLADIPSIVRAKYG